MTTTYRATFSTPTGPYHAYVDASTPNRARRFFERWLGRLTSDAFPCALMGVAEWVKEVGS